MTDLRELVRDTFWKLSTGEISTHNMNLDEQLDFKTTTFLTLLESKEGEEYLKSKGWVKLDEDHEIVENRRLNFPIN